MSHRHGKQMAKVRKLFDASMAEGGTAVFGQRFEQSLGVVRDESGHAEYDPEQRAVDHEDLPPEVCCEALMGPRWRSTFEQHWQEAARRRTRFEGIGSAVMPGELATVSGAFDVFAGLVGARMLARPQLPKFIWDRMCRVVPNLYEGGFDIGTRPDYDVSAVNTTNGIDLAPGQRGPTVTMKPTRVHRNRPMRQQKFVKINWHTARNDLTGTLYSSVDEVADIVLFERERKVADAVLGISAGTTLATAETIGTPGLAMPMSQDGLTWFPWQAGTFGTNANSKTPSPQNQKLVANYANANETDGQGLTDYGCMVRALKILTLNRDPFTQAPIDAMLEGMKFFVAPGSEPQLRSLLQAFALWQLNNAAGPISAFTANQTSFNYLASLNLEVITSQYWTSRLTDVGVYKVSSTGAVTHQTLTNAASDTYNTVGSVYSALYAGHFGEAVNYDQIMPYESVALPLSSEEIAEQTISYNMFQEDGQAYWVHPRKVWRAWA